MRAMLLHATLHNRLVLCVDALAAKQWGASLELDPDGIYVWESTGSGVAGIA